MSRKLDFGAVKPLTINTLPNSAFRLGSKLAISSVKVDLFKFLSSSLAIGQIIIGLSSFTKSPKPLFSSKITLAQKRTSSRAWCLSEIALLTSNPGGKPLERE